MNVMMQMDCLPFLIIALPLLVYSFRLGCVLQDIPAPSALRSALVTAIGAVASVLTARAAADDWTCGDLIRNVVTVIALVLNSASVTAVLYSLTIPTSYHKGLRVCLIQVAFCVMAGLLLTAAQGSMREVS